MICFRCIMFLHKLQIKTRFWKKKKTLSKYSTCTCSLFPRMFPMYSFCNASSKSLFDAQPPGCRNRTQQTKAQRKVSNLTFVVFYATRSVSSVFKSLSYRPFSPNVAKILLTESFTKRRIITPTFQL